MQRFYSLLNAILPQVEWRGDYARITYTTYQDYRNAWSARQHQGEQKDVRKEMVRERSDLPKVWMLYGLSLLWHDHYLSLPLREMGDDWHMRYTWFAETKEALRARMHEPQEVLHCIAAGFCSLHDLASKLEPRGAALRPKDVDELEYYRSVQRFFGRAFTPLLRAHALLDDTRRVGPALVLHDSGTTLCLSELNRAAIQSLGIDGYHAPLRRRRQSQAPERCEISLASYTVQERDQVAQLLVTGGATHLPVRHVLCELALRGQVREGTYSLHVDGVDGVEEKKMDFQRFHAAALGNQHLQEGNTL